MNALSKVDRPTILATKQHITTQGQLVIGYARVGDGDPLRLTEGTNAIAAFARQHKLMLGTVFTTRATRRPSVQHLGQYEGCQR